MATKQQYGIGEIVRLKSGGPSMTVCGDLVEDDCVPCQWFRGFKKEAGVFKQDTLEPCEADDRSDYLEEE